MTGLMQFIVLAMGTSKSSLSLNDYGMCVWVCQGDGVVDTHLDNREGIVGWYTVPLVFNTCPVQIIAKFEIVCRCAKKRL
ncbi:MAG: hypothetical protein H6Q65_2196 [Firmicutes bacterium]|nr:hypothetical protein [Bacillota bacterium]